MAFNISYFGIDSEALPPGWRTGRLSELAMLNPEQINANHAYQNIVYLDIANVSKGIIGTPEFLSSESAPSRAKRIVRENDTIISTVRPGNRAFAFLKGVPANLIVSSGFAVLRPRGQDVDPRFIYYLSTSNPLIDYLASIAEEKTAYPSVKPEDISECVVPIPPISEQRSISHILGTLDDKIELNRKMNETLEAIARAIFKSWFVDFDPVRAKADGRDPGLPKEIADLFPDRFEDSELCKIPAGWKVCCVSEIGEVICGKTPSTKVPEYYCDHIPFITIPDMHGKVFATNTQKKLSRKGAASQSKKTLPIGAICVSCIATPGLVVITTEESQTNQQINSIIPEERDQTYFWYWTFRNLGHEIRSAGSGGSVVTNLSTGRFVELAVLASLPNLRRQYNVYVQPLFNRILANSREISTLAVLRDALLPKLISGGLRVRDEERPTSEV